MDRNELAGKEVFMRSGLTAIVVASVALLVAPADAHAQHTANGAPSSGTAVPSGGGSSNSAPTSSSSGTSGSASTSSGGSSSGSASSGRRWTDSAAAARRAGGSSVGANAPTRDSRVSIAVPQFSRPRNGAPITGYAIPRSAAPPTSGVTFTPVGYPYFSPYGYYGYSGFAGAALFGFYDPFDPFVYEPFGPAFFPLGGGGGGYSSSSSNDENEGALRLKVTPDKAKIYVDGGLVGSVYDYEGLFHKLHLEAGVHRVELRATGYETMTLNVRIERGQTMTYKGTLQKAAR